MNRKRRILLVDDHALVRAGIRALLNEIPGVEVVAETGDGIDAIERIRRDPPDAVLLDIALPGSNGIEVADRVRRLGVPTRVLILSMHTGPDYVARALAAGAAGYLIKDAAFEELATALTTIFSGQRYLSRGIDEAIVRSLEAPGGAEASPLDLLTPRQRQVLQLIAEGSGTREIAERLHLSVKTVETHRAQLMQRLGIHDLSGLVRLAIRTGIVTPEA